MSYLKDREIWLSNVPTSNPPAGYVWVFIQNGVFVVRDSNGLDKIMATTTGTVTNATSASYVEYSNVASKPALISGSSQVSYTGLSNIPVGIVSGSAQVTYSGLTGVPSGIVSGSAQVASFGIFATTGSNGFNGSQSITGSLTVTGQVVAQTLNVQQVTSSIVYSSGSNIFGNSLSNTQQFTGSVSVTGSFTVTTTGTELQVTSTGVNMGNALTDSHIISGSLRVNPNGLFVSGSGNVGIGTTTPQSIFHIGAAAPANAGVKPYTGLSSTDEGFLFDYYYNTSASNVRVFDIAALGFAVNGAGGSELRFLTVPQTTTNTPLERMRITSGGNIEIGTTGFSSPSSADRFIGVYGAQDCSLILQDAVQTWELYVNDDFYINRGSTNVLTALRANGNVGIGTASPSQKLVVEGSEAIVSIVDNRSFSTGVGGALYLLGNYRSVGDVTVAGYIKGSKVNSTDGDYGFNLIFGTQTYTGGVSEKLRITSDGYLRMAASTGGIQFNGDTASANALDDYEEGTWTPVVKIGTTTNTASATSGTYVKIGRVVYINATITSITKNGAGGLTITNLPFTVSATGGELQGSMRWDDITSSGFLSPYFGSGTTVIVIQNFSNTGYVDTIQDTAISSTYQLYGVTGFYYV